MSCIFERQQALTFRVQFSEASPLAVRILRPALANSCLLFLFFLISFHHPSKKRNIVRYIYIYKKKKSEMAIIAYEDFWFFGGYLHHNSMHM